MRQHLNSKFEFDECKSWMREDESKCNLDLSNPEWRRYYLDELFVQSKISTPYWYQDTLRLYNLNNLKITKSFTLKRYQFEYFDSLLFSKGNDWILNFKATRSQEPHYFGIVVNDIAVDTNLARKGESLEPRMIISHLKPRRTVLETASSSQDIDISLIKQDRVIFIYFDKKISYRIPIGSTPLKIGALSSSLSDTYSINFFDQ